MRYALTILLVNLIAAPAAAQEIPGPPTPAMREQMEQARTNAKAAVMDSLSASHRSAVASIVSAFEDGDLSMCQAAEKIDGVLSPSESAQAIAQEQKMRASLPPLPPMHAGFAPGGAPPKMEIVQMRRHKADAGEIVLMLAAMP